MDLKYRICGGCGVEDRNLWRALVGAVTNPRVI